MVNGGLKVTIYIWAFPTSAFRMSNNFSSAVVRLISQGILQSEFLLTVDDKKKKKQSYGKGSGKTIKKSVTTQFSECVAGEESSNKKD